MDIKGSIKHSLVNWDGKISSVLFLPYCTFRCGWCYARDLVLESDKLLTIPFNEIKKHLIEHKKFIDGVVITGGEPTIHLDLPDLCKKLKAVGFPVKLDTNGTNPEMVKQLFKKKLIDYIAMDVKAPLTEDEYDKINGNRNLLVQVKESIHFITSCGIDYEFRTTCVPGLHNEKSIEEIAKSIKRAKKWALQNFMVPYERGKLIDPKFEKVRSFSDEEMKKFQEIAKKYVRNTILRI